MSFKKLRFGKQEIFNTIVKDLDGRELENFKVNKEDFPKAAKILFKKYGLDWIVIPKKRKKEEDLGWAI